MAGNNTIKHHAFQKCSSYTISLVLNRLGYLFVIPFVITVICIVLSKIVKPVDFTTIMLYLGIIAELAGIIFMLWDTFRLKGVFLYKDCMEITTSIAYQSVTARKFKHVSYADISYVDYVGSFRSDPESRYSRRNTFAHNNFLGGNYLDCVKIVLKNGTCAFVSSENCIELLADIRDRMIAVGNENAYTTQENAYAIEELEITTNTKDFAKTKWKLILTRCFSCILVALVPIITQLVDKNPKGSIKIYSLLAVLLPVILMFGNSKQKRPTYKKSYSSKEYYIALAVTTAINLALCIFSYLL